MASDVKVEQRHRDAAADLIETYWSGADASMIKLAKSYRNGSHTQGVFPRAFANFEASLTPATDGVVHTQIEAVAARRQKIADITQDVAPDLGRAVERLQAFADSQHEPMPADPRHLSPDSPSINFADVRAVLAALSANREVIEAETLERAADIEGHPIREAVLLLEGVFSWLGDRALPTHLKRFRELHPRLTAIKAA